MEIIKELKKQESAKSNKDYRMLKSVNAGDYRLSVQGSEASYCMPRRTLNLDDYSSMEIAIFNIKGAFININRSSVIKKFKRYDELLERADAINSKYPVYGYVPIDLINDLYLFLLNN